MRPSVRVSVSLSVFLSFYLTDCPTVRPSVHPSIHPSVCPSIRPSIRQSIRPSVCFSALLSASLFLSACPSARLCMDHPVACHDPRSAKPSIQATLFKLEILLQAVSRVPLFRVKRKFKFIRAGLRGVSAMAIS